MPTELPSPSPANPSPEPARSPSSSPPSSPTPAAPSSPIDWLLQDPARFAFFTCALGIVACFFAPWVRLDRGVSAYDFCRAGDWGLFVAVLPALALISLVAYADEEGRRRAGTMTGVVSWLTVFYFFKKVGMLGVVSLSWGASLTLLFGLGLFAMSGKQRLTMPLDLVTKRLNSRKAEVFSHWGSVTPDMHFSAQEFYAKVEAAIRSKEWPGVQLLRVEYREAGLFSHSREYLRIIRQRQLFDVCGAEFGKDYFFSLREAEIPAVVDLHAFVTFLLGLFMLTIVCLQTFGLLFGPLALLFLIVFAVWFMFNVLKLGMNKADSAMLTLPVIGPVYEAWFRPDTYFQQDTRLFFLHCVTELVKRHVAETTSANGVKQLHGFEKKPILDGLYKPFVTPLDQPR